MQATAIILWLRITHYTTATDNAFCLLLLRRHFSCAHVNLKSSVLQPGCPAPASQMPSDSLKHMSE